MTTATEKAIEAREAKSLAAAKKRGIGKYAKGAFDLEDYIDEDEKSAPKVKKS